MKYLHISFLLLLSSFLSAQEISIEFSIEWKTENSFLKNFNKEEPIPFVVVTYRNLSDKSVYLRSLGNGEYYLPNNSSALLNVNKWYDKYDKPINLKHFFQGDSYFYDFRDFCVYEIGNDDNEVILPPINYFFKLLYDNLKLQKILDEEGTEKQLRSFVYPNKKYVTFNEVKNLYYKYEDEKSKDDSFIFLDPRTFKRERMSMLGLFLLKGDYEIGLLNYQNLIPVQKQIYEKGKCYKAVEKGSIVSNSVKLLL